MRKQNMVKAGIYLVVAAVLAVFAIQTAWVFFNFMLHTVEAVEFGMDPTGAKELFYNSGNWYIRWLSNMTNEYVRVPFGLFVIASPFLFLLGVRQYNLSQRRKARK